MLNQFFKYTQIVLATLVISACASQPAPVTSDQASVQEKTVRPILSPQDQTRYQQALEALQSGKTDKAEGLLEALLAQYPTLAGAHVNLGIIYQSSGDDDRAMSEFDDALSINSNNTDALLQRASLWQSQGKFRRAEQDLNRLLDIDDDHRRAHFNLGVLYELYLQEYDAAIDHYERYVELSNEADVDVVKRWIMLLERK